MRLVYGRMSYSRHTCPACAGRGGSWVVAVVACADAQGAVPDRAPRNSRTLVRQTAARIRQLHLSFSSCNSGLPVPVLADHDGRIVPAEAKAVAHRVADCALPWLMGRVVEIAFGVRVVEIDRRRDDTGRQRLDRDDQFDAAAGSQRMSELALGARDAQRSSVFAEHVLDGLRFGFIAKRRAGAVRVDVVDLFRRQSAVVEGIGHGSRGAIAVFVWLSDMAGVAARPKPHDLAVDPGAAGLGVFELFEHENAGAFAEHKTVAIDVERAARR